MSKPHLKSITLANFRAHEDLHVEFAPGLNVITGDNNAGKTTVLNAIQYAIGREALAKERAITVGHTRARVAFSLTNGVSVERVVSSSENVITVSQDGEVVQSLSKPRSEALDALHRDLEQYGLGPLVLPNGEERWMWLQRSNDLFLVGDSDLVVKRTLSSLAGSDVFESARDICKSRRSDHSKALSAVESELAEAKTELIEVTKKRDVAVPLAEKLEEEMDKLESLRKASENVSRLLGRWAGIAANAIPEETIEKLTDSYTEASKQAIDFKEKAEHSEAVAALRSAIESGKRAYRAAKEEVIKRSEEVKAARDEALKEGHCPVCGRSADSDDPEGV